MATFNDSAALAAVMKEFYDGQVVRNEVYKGSPWLALVKKNEDVSGKVHPVPIQIGVSQGRSALFANAQANQTANKFKSFLVTQADDFALATVTDKAIAQTRNDDGAFIEAVKSSMDGAIQSIQNSLGESLFGSGTGVKGKVGVINSGVITLDDPESIVKFELSMKLASATTDGGALDAGTGYVIMRDTDAGTITVALTDGGNAATPSGWAAGHFLYQDGDENAKLTGLAGWLPTTAPVAGADSFFGVDRGVDPTRLAGVRYDGTGYSIEEALIKAEGRLAREGGRADVCFLNFNAYSGLKAALGSKVQYVNVKSGVADISFEGLRIHGSKGPIDVIPDRYCPGSVAYLLQKDSWSLGSLGTAPFVVENDGNKWLRVSNAAAQELRIAYFANLECNAPVYNAVVSIKA